MEKYDVCLKSVTCDDASNESKSITIKKGDSFIIDRQYLCRQEDTSTRGYKHWTFLHPNPQSRNCDHCCYMTFTKSGKYYLEDFNGNRFLTINVEDSEYHHKIIEIKCDDISEFSLVENLGLYQTLGKEKFLIPFEEGKTYTIYEGLVWTSELATYNSATDDCVINESILDDPSNTADIFTKIISNDKKYLRVNLNDRTRYILQITDNKSNNYLTRNKYRFKIGRAHV